MTTTDTPGTYWHSLAESQAAGTTRTCRQCHEPNPGTYDTCHFCQHPQPDTDTRTADGGR